ncbi:MAG: LysM peptidoglycan-binding domain-containing protein, partial [Bacteroidota bacterium]
QDSIHTVNKGETLYSLSKQFSISIDTLQAWNALENTYIKTGQQLIVWKKPILEDTLRLEVFPKDSIHTVKNGEIISGIAAKYNINSKQLVDWNNLESPDKIYPNQRLKLYPSMVEKIIAEKDNILQNKDQEMAHEVGDALEKSIEDSIEINTPILVINEEPKPKAEKARNQQLTYDFNPGGVKTALNVLILIVLLVVFIYNIHK